ncbi:MAG: 4Fe-4S binding protein [Coriobacteriales bacterium]|jgi:ferredoxin|nr:4Fe-4S binding protein [Coriobacteriales bacterium]
MPKLSAIFDLFDGLQSNHIRTHQNRCVTVRNRNATCRRCAEACTSNAISIKDNEIFFTPHRCIGCGTCATVCPTGALEPTEPNDTELLLSCLKAAKQADGEAVIACEQLLDAASGLFDPEKVVRVTCLGRIDESLLLALVVAGVSSISLVQSTCAECEHAVGMKTAELVVATTNTLLDVWDNPLRIGITNGLPDTLLIDDLGYDPSRRGFFLGIAGRAKTAASAILDDAVENALEQQEEAAPRYQKVLDDGTLPHFLPDRRERLLDRLAQLGDPKDEVLKTRLWGHVTIDLKTCNGCTMCATFCPTAALSKFLESETNERISLEHYSGDCVKCRCCEDICPTKALVLCEAVQAQDLSNGKVESFAMRASSRMKDNRHSILNSMQTLLGVDQITEC